MTTNNRKKNRRQGSLNSYVDKTIQKYSKIDVIRLDLFYKTENRDSVTLESFDKDLSRLYNNKRSNSIFDNVVGHAIKIEQGDAKHNHLHAHALFFVNGQKSKDKSACSVAKSIGEYWDKTITKDKGSHHNCNMKKYKKHGLGRIEYNNTNKIKILKKNVLSYFCKGEQSIKSPDGKNIRVLRRGAMPKHSNKGRPRKSANPKSDKNLKD